MSMTKRTDVHRPSVISPEDYKFVEGLAGYHDYRYPASRCAHCGKAIRYAIRFDHLPTGNRIEVGEECANYLDSPDRISYLIKQLKTAARNAAKKEKAEMQWFERREVMEEQAPDVVEWMEEHQWNTERFDFLHSMKAAYERWGSLTERQIDSVRNIMQKRAEQAARQLEEAEQLESAPAAPEGRQTVTGQIVSVKWHDSYYGRVCKMLVKLLDGNKVYGTVPESIHEYVADTENASYNDLWVRFAGTFTRSETDEHFSTFKRPAKVEVIGNP